MQKSSFILHFLLLFITATWAVNSNYDTYSVLDGLSNSSIKAIYQDKLGFMWFGTKDGLNRFDGNEFKTYRFYNKKSNTLYFNDITCIKPDLKGRLWIGTFDGIIVFDLETEEFIDFNQMGVSLSSITGVVTEIYIDYKKRVWVSTKKGLFLIDSSNYSIKTVLKGSLISCMSEYSDKILLAEIYGKGLVTIDIKSLKINPIYKKSTLKRPLLSKMHKDKNGQIWLGARTNNLYLLSTKDKVELPVYITSKDGTVFNNEQIHCINEINDTSLILGTDKGMITLSLNRLEWIENHYRISGTIMMNDDRIMSLSKDNQGGLWIGTFNKGIKYLNPYRNKFNFLDLKVNSDVRVGIIGNLVENEGVLWVGHEKGISSVDMTTGESKYYNIQTLVSKNSRSNESYFIYKNTPNQLYFYLLNNGLFILDLKSMRILNRVNLPPNSQIRSIMKDKDGKLWIAEEDLSIYDPVKNSINNNLETNNKLFTKFILTQDLLQLRNGNMLVGTRTKGLFQYIYKNSDNYSKVESLPIKGLENSNISVLFEDSKERIWIGTYSSGLFCYDFAKNQLKVYNKARGLSHNMICGILEDNISGNIWISTFIGVSKIDTKKSIIRNYTSKNGLPLSEMSVHSFLKGTNGAFYAGGNNGIVSFKPQQFTENPFKPVVQITSVQSLSGLLDEKPVNYTTRSSLRNVQIKYSDSFFQIKFAALSYLFPKENKYAYKLEGFDKEWVTTDRSDAIYTNLTEGSYTFLVKACNNDGVWSENHSTLSITVLPPFWRTWWAKTFYITILLLILYIFVQYLIIRNTYKYQLQIDKIEKDNIEKNYQMKISLFTNFSHELRTPLTLIVGPVADILHDLELPTKFEYPIQLINKNVNRLLVLVNQLMDFRKIEYGALKLQVQNIDVKSFLDDILDSFEEFALKKQIKISRIYEYSGADSWFDALLIEKVIFNLLSNALKNSSQGDVITIRVFEENHYLVFSVKDTGTGIDSSDLERIFDPFYQVNQGSTKGMFGTGIGLNLSKDIVTLHQGLIWASSNLGQGATFFVKLHLGNKHFKSLDLNLQPVFNESNLNKSVEVNSLSIINTNENAESHSKSTIILVVEDDADLRKYIMGQLQLDYTVIDAEDGKKGFEIALNKLPDLIISDVMMPIMSGIELCDQIKTDIRTAHIPVILLTAMVMNTQIQEGFEHGADDYILKPFDATLLKARVKNLIESRLKLRKLFAKKFVVPEVKISEISSDDKLMQKLMVLIEQNVSNSDFSIDDVTQEIGMSRAQLYRKIKVMTDLTPNNLIMQIRMKTAIALLKTNNYNISDVAYRVGFSDPAYFSKYFKSVYKMTPTEFINE